MTVWSGIVLDLSGEWCYYNSLRNGTICSTRNGFFVFSLSRSGSVIRFPICVRICSVVSLHSNVPFGSRCLSCFVVCRSAQSSVSCTPDFSDGKPAIFHGIVRLKIDQHEFVTFRLTQNRVERTKPTPIDADIDLTMKLLVIVRSIDCAIEATRMFIVELNNEYYYTANGFMLQHQHTLNIIMWNVPNVNDSPKSSVTCHIDDRFLFDWISWRWSMQGWQKTIPFVAASITNEQWARARRGRTHCNFGVNWACQLFFCQRSKELSNPRSNLFMIHPFTGFIHSRFNNGAKQNKTKWTLN